MIEGKGMSSCVTPFKMVTVHEVGFDNMAVIDDLDKRSFRRVMEPEARPGWGGIEELIVGD